MPLPLPSGLTAPVWRQASRRLLAKAVAEFSYEDILVPELSGNDTYRIPFQNGVEYTFRARRGAFGSWWVDDASLRRTLDGVEEVAESPLLFIRDAQETLGLDGGTASRLVCELSATLLADTRLLDGAGISSTEMAGLSYAEVEGYQSGHPWVVPNKGRIGFSAGDSARYAPEARQPVRLPWIAAHESIAACRSVPNLTQQHLLEEELDGSTRERFNRILRERGLPAEEFRWLPVHPWQWDEVVVPLFADELSAGRIVPLGEGPDRYLPQQSIRTFTNIDRPLGRHVKLPLSIFNTMVWRGLPTERTLAAPALTHWVQELLAADPWVVPETGFALLGEVASTAIEHRLLASITHTPYRYRELLGVVWRESVSGKLGSGERARTLASLLYVDPAGRPFVAELIERSGLSARRWLEALVHAVLPPLVHFLYRYGLVFTPHGENAIVVYDADERPSRLVVKDLVDDINISAQPMTELASIPPEVAAVLWKEEPHLLRHHIVTGLFVCHFRYLANLADTSLGVLESDFWEIVRTEILAYQEAFPELVDRFARFDLLGAKFERIALNRNRVLVDGYRDLDERPPAVRRGVVPNPLHRR